MFHFTELFDQQILFAARNAISHIYIIFLPFFNNFTQCDDIKPDSFRQVKELSGSLVTKSVVFLKFSTDSRSSCRSAHTVGGLPEGSDWSVKRC
jgi:hypothetical protein